MGCGRGAVLTAVARRLTTGRVTGVDIWSTHDQSGNARDVTVRNASLEGVGDRVEVETGDMRALPFPDATFDLVVSSLAIHNIRSNADRKQAVAEGFRVLKPGGRMVIADIRATAALRRDLAGARRVECGTPPARVEILVGQPGRGHDPAHRFKSAHSVAVRRASP